MGEWTAAEGKAESSAPPFGAISLNLGEIDWEDAVTLSLPRGIVEMMENIVGQIGLGSIQQISDTSYALVSSQQGASLAKMLAELLMKGQGEGEAEPPS